MDKEKTLKILGVVKNVVTWVVVAIAALAAVLAILSATIGGGKRTLFGYKVFVVLSDSMKATDFAAGDLIFVKEVDPSTLKEGDIISYLSTDTSNFGKIVTHKIRRAESDAFGNPGFITYGTTTGEDDKKLVTYAYIEGKYCGKISKAGYFFNFLKTVPGYIVCILVPFLLLILSQGITSVRLFKEYKAEQSAAIENERSALAAERAETQRMKEELLALKAELAEKSDLPESKRDLQSEGEKRSSESERNPQKTDEKEGESENGD